MDAAAAFHASGLFEGFTDTGISILSGIATPKNYPAGTPLFAENMVSDSLLIISEGKVKLSTKGANGKELPMGELGPGDWLGELSLISTGQRQCTATALAEVHAFEIRQSDVQKLMASKPQACIKLLMRICTTFGQKVVANKDAIKTLLGKV
jgi:CRP/FNR family cyclic AMP-dependent transcriptional regulator